MKDINALRQWIAENSQQTFKINEQLRDLFFKTEDYNDFERYVMSESIAPSEDDDNMIKLIRENSYRYLNTKLLLVGSHLISWGSRGRNDLLEILNILYPYFPDREKAIVSFLNAYDIKMNEVKIRRKFYT